MMVSLQVYLGVAKSLMFLEERKKVELTSKWRELSKVKEEATYENILL